jgi:uncharacterized protein
MTPRWNRALVTGASSGIGLEIARQLAAEGTQLVIVARDETRLKSLAAEVAVICEVLVADLSDPVQLATVEARVSSDNNPIDLLVNNAGFGFVGQFDEMDRDKETSVIDVNITALLRLTHAAAGAMRGRVGKRGILNVSSVAGFIPSPTAATYSATKAFVTSFSQAIHEEMKPHGVAVTALCPGYTRTEFQDRANAGESVNKVPERMWQLTEPVATAGLDGVFANKPIAIPGTHNKAAAGLISALPKGAVRRLVSVGSKRT